MSFNKFHAVSTVCMSRHKHPSKGEARRCDELALMQRGGAITDLVQQPVVELEPGIGYRVDFSYILKGNSFRTWEDFKGVETERFRLICKLWVLHGPGPLRVSVTGGAGPCKIDRVIFPKEK